MVVYVYKNAWGEFSYWDRKQYYPSEQCGIFWCILEQPDQQPEKKTVVKEVKFDENILNLTGWSGSGCINYEFPPNAKNKKLTYEVEE